MNIQNHTVRMPRFGVLRRPADVLAKPVLQPTLFERLALSARVAWLAWRRRDQEIVAILRARQ